LTKLQVAFRALRLRPCRFVEDVIGFIENKGKGFKLCGFWKVYGDVEKSAALFKEYSWCRKKLEELVKNGGISSAAEALASVAM
jgi:hypothetical protein